MATQQVHWHSQQRPEAPSASQPNPLSFMFPAMFPVGAEHLDPHLLDLAAQAGAAPPPIDPALFAIEQVVNDVNRGRIAPADIAMAIQAHASAMHTGEATDKPAENEPEPEPHSELQPRQSLSEAHTQVQHQQSSEAVESVPSQVTQPEEVSEHVELPHVDGESHLEHDGIDPALREIVDSLTNAQQSHHPSLPGDAEERDRIDHETIRTTLEDYAAQNGFGSYGAIFGNAFPPSPHTHNLLLPSLNNEAMASTHPAHEVEITPPPVPEGATEPAPVAPVKRGRGRPKGSKNKPKPAPPTPEPEPESEAQVEPEQPRRRKGRPPKVRSAEEIADIERRKEEKALGITRKRGRPRKYPELGLVREMRLKKNRQAVQEKIRQLEERARQEAVKMEGVEATPAAEVDDIIQAAAAAAASAVAASQAEREVALGEQVAAAVAREQEQTTTHYEWPYQDNQTLLDVVRGVGIAMGEDQRMDGEGLSAEGNGEMGQSDIPHVFTLGELERHT